MISGKWALFPVFDVSVVTGVVEGGNGVLAPALNP